MLGEYLGGMLPLPILLSALEVKNAASDVTNPLDAWHPLRAQFWSIKGLMVAHVSTVGPPGFGSGDGNGAGGRDSSFSFGIRPQENSANESSIERMNHSPKSSANRLQSRTKIGVTAMIVSSCTDEPASIWPI